jgi:ribonuclease P protein component
VKKRDARFNFPPSARLKKKQDFVATQEVTRGGGLKSYGRGLLLLARKKKSGPSRLGVTVTLKIDKRAVVRNRIKRCVREIFRQLRAEFICPIDVVAIARNDAPSFKYSDFEREFRQGLQRLGFLEKTPG